MKYSEYSCNIVEIFCAKWAMTGYAFRFMISSMSGSLSKLSLIPLCLDFYVCRKIRFEDVRHNSDSWRDNDDQGIPVKIRGDGEKPSSYKRFSFLIETILFKTPGGCSHKWLVFPEPFTITPIRDTFILLRLKAFETIPVVKGLSDLCAWT